MKVEVGYFPDRRLKLLLRCNIGDKNLWYDDPTNSYTICLSQDMIFLLEAYFAFNAYNIWKRRKRHQNN